MHNVYELNRLWVADDVPKNGESFLISHTLKMLDKEIIVSFADTSQNHIGYVYQATNFLYCGLSAKFRDPKVKGLEHMHHSTYAHGMTMKQVKEKYGEENVYYVDRPRKHRYIYFNADKRRKKELKNKLRYKVQDYPKTKELRIAENQEIKESERMNIDEAIEFIGNLCLEYRSKGMEEPLTENYEKYTPVADKLNNVKALLIEIKAKKPPKDYSEAYNKGHTEGYQEGVSKSIEQGIKIGKSLVLDTLKETFDDFLEDMESD